MPISSLQSMRGAELPRPIQVVIAVVSVILATGLLLAVKSYIPGGSAAGHFALAALFIAAVPGYMTLCSIVVTSIRNARAQPGAEQ